MVEKEPKKKITCPEDFKNKYIDLSNTELNGEMTEERFERLKECFIKIGANLSKNIDRNVPKNFVYVRYTDDNISGLNRVFTENHISSYSDNEENMQEVSVHDILGFDEAKGNVGSSIVRVSEEDIDDCERFVLVDGVPQYINVDNDEPFYHYLEGDAENIVVKDKNHNVLLHVTKTNFQAIKEFLENGSKYKKGSRMWAVEMALEKGHKLQNKSSGWMYEYMFNHTRGDYSIECLAVRNIGGKTNSFFFDIPKDGWELYKEPEEKKTMTLREAIEQQKTFELDGTTYGVEEYLELFVFDNITDTFKNLDKQVEIIEE